MKEKLQEYALFAEVISAVAIVISLIFVGLQIQEGNREVRAAALQTRNSEIEAAFQMYALSELLPPIYDKLQREGFDSLTSVEVLRLTSWETSRIFRMQGQFRNYQLGYLDENALLDLTLAVNIYRRIWIAADVDYLRLLDPELVSLLDN